MKVNYMTQEDFHNVPRIEKTNFDPRKDSFRSIVIIPCNDMHDSGYLCMEYILVSEEQEPICRIGGGSDVILIDGAGGYGEHILECKRTEDGKPCVEPKGWRIDCLPCGYLRLFASKKLHLERRPYWDSASVEIFAD